jgi:catechol 2,3-dioxygenase-like lactoylglutathione lyase family enzyme
MLDHVGVIVSDLEKSKKFYTDALKPIGYALMRSVAPAQGQTGRAGFGVPPRADFWIYEGTPNDPPLHVAFRVSTRALVDVFYQAAMAAGGKNNGAPGLRPQYNPNYYGAFVLDPDGHNIEAVCREPAS